MARRVIAACAVVLALWSLGGCGTICNVAYSPQDADGGVQSDVSSVRSATADAAAGKGDPSKAVLGAYMLFIDLPLSFIGDTLSLPYFLYVHGRMGY
jgi:uncharacterized protein YceK